MSFIRTPKSPSRVSSPAWASKSTLGSRRRSLRESSFSTVAASDSGAGESAELLAAKDEEIMQLNHQLDAESRRAAMLESELKLALAAAQRAEEAHQREMKSVEGDVQRMLGERRSLLEKLHTIEVVEDSVRELYVQMKDRVADEGRPTPEQLQAEKEALKGESILVVLGALHALLKNLWAFKVEAEDDLQANRLAHQQRAHDQVQAMRGRVRDLEAGVRQLQQEVAAATLRADMAEDSHARLLTDSQSMAASMSAQHAELVAALKNTTSEYEAARRAVTTANAEGRKRDGLVLANRQLESARHFDRVAQDKELRRMHAEHTLQLSAMQAELARISELMAENDLLKGKLHKAAQATQQLKAAQAGPSRVRELEHRVRFLEGEIDRLERVIAVHGIPGAAASGTLAAAVGLAGYGNAGRHSPASGVTHQSAAAQSMASRASAIMDAARKATRQEARERAAERPDDPIYTVIANVGVMHKQAKAAIREAKKELNDGPSRSRERCDAGVPVATADLDTSRSPRKGSRLIGAAGTNSAISGGAAAAAAAAGGGGGAGAKAPTWATRVDRGAFLGESRS